MFVRGEGLDEAGRLTADGSPSDATSRSGSILLQVRRYGSRSFSRARRCEADALLAH